MKILQMRNPSNTNGLLDLIKGLPSDLIMAEIGCYAGESSKLFLSSNKINTLYAIDIWRDSLGIYSEIDKTHSFEMVEKVFDENMASIPNKKVIKLKMDLKSALPHLPALDFVYIDANHDYDFVKSDILNSLKVLKSNGIIGGHDYNDGTIGLGDSTLGVIQAVNEIFIKPDVVFSDSSWMVKLNNRFTNL